MNAVDHNLTHSDAALIRNDDKKRCQEHDEGRRQRRIGRRILPDIIRYKSADVDIVQTEDVHAA